MAKGPATAPVDAIGLHTTFTVAITDAAIAAGDVAIADLCDCGVIRRLYVGGLGDVWLKRRQDADYVRYRLVPQGTWIWGDIISVAGKDHGGTGQGTTATGLVGEV